jgi:hypothetical protein
MAITCWYSGTAFIALLQACRVENLAREANEGLDVLTHAVEQLQQMWASANIIRQGFDRLRQQTDSTGNTRIEAAAYSALGKPSDDPDIVQDFDWTVLFPFVTTSTSAIAKALLPLSEQQGRTTRFPSPENALFQETFLHDYQGLLEPFSSFGAWGFSDSGMTV